MILHSWPEFGIRLSIDEPQPLLGAGVFCFRPRGRSPKRRSLGERARGEPSNSGAVKAGGGSIKRNVLTKEALCALPPSALVAPGLPKRTVQFRTLKSRDVARGLPPTKEVERASRRRHDCLEALSSVHEPYSQNLARRSTEPDNQLPTCCDRAAKHPGRKKHTRGERPEPEHSVRVRVNCQPTQSASRPKKKKW